ncbi:hypothetical protein GCM10011490_21540 [Pseudoclavibacter endophyticus]|nr:hypothetical protein GCM10011490_21540 [Pseudoclavibacter endophyticus]
MLGSAEAFDADIRRAEVGNLGLLSFAYGAPVEITPAPLESFVAVHVPLAGRLDITAQRGEPRTASVGPGAGAIISSTDRVRMRWSRNLRLLVLRIDRERLEAKLRDDSGASRPGDLVFEPVVGHGAADRAIANAIRTVHSTAEHFGAAGVPAELAGELEELIVSLLVLEHRHSRREATDGRRSGTPRVLPAAREALRASGAERVTVADLARAAHVSERTLYEAFRREAGCSPMAWVRRYRLEAARRVLAAAGPADGTTVIAVARAHGFGHAGRFAAEYRARYGEPPSATLRA